MKKILLLLILNSHPIAIGFLSLNSFSQSPNWLWAKTMGGTTEDYGRSIAVDASGNVYTTGSFEGTVDFDPGAGVFNITAADGDIFISKLDSSGDFVWAKAMGGPYNDQAFSIAIDPSGSGYVYTTGDFQLTADFDPGAGTFNLTSAGQYDIFISKLDTSGNFIWAKRMGGTGWDEGNSIAIDLSGSGDVYTTGKFVGTADFDPGAGVFNLTTVGGDDIFISRLNSSGNFVYAKRIGGITGNNSKGHTIAIDPSGSGDVYTSGEFYGTVDFDPGAGVFNLTSGGYRNIFISKLDSSGNFVWAKVMGDFSDDIGLSIAIDPGGSGAVYTTGFFEGTFDFDPGSGTFNLTSAGYADIFISKLDASGNFVWAKAIGSVVGYDKGYSIAIDPSGSGDVYTAGQFWGTADFDPDSLGSFNLTSAGSQDLFISKLDSSGNFVWAKAVGGTGIEGGFIGTGNSDLRGSSIAFGDSGNVYFTGVFKSPSITFGATTLTNVGSYDLFIARLDTAIVTGINSLENFDGGISIFPNPFSNSTTIYFSLSQSQKVSLKIFDVNGRLISILVDKYFDAGENEIVWNAADVNAGVYFLHYETSGCSENRKLIVAK